MSKRTSSLSLFLALLLVVFLLIFQFTTKSHLYISFSVLLITALIMNFLSTSKNFILILTIIFSTGFSLAVLSGTSIKSQTYLIGEYILLMAALILMWLVFAEAKRNSEELTSLRKKAEELEKYVGTSNLLTHSEFTNRIKVIMAGTQRRGEENFYISVKTTPLNTTKESMNFLLMQTLLQTVRSDFDLVTKLADGSYLVFLQNTKKEGCLKVVERLYQSLRTELNLIQLPISYEILNQEQGHDYYVDHKDGELKK
ncbi:hypothetical protein [Carnobacterium antarcticum]|uniref:GGDEF domain-containing protein n=1 Tax=Carnobacterium antarcticum TaxID=2126436 RepID=A0ABW4NL21_9LACT|nr:hypothetical protein [Carnobacterium sp. CP1]ALV22018.1 hypothetical protein NY10_1413 [Carnobacterium sp. CP1]